MKRYQHVLMFVMVVAGVPGCTATQLDEREQSEIIIDDSCPGHESGGTPTGGAGEVARCSPYAGAVLSRNQYAAEPIGSSPCYLACLTANWSCKQACGDNPACRDECFHAEKGCLCTCVYGSWTCPTQFQWSQQRHDEFCGGGAPSS